MKRPKTAARRPAPLAACLAIVLLAGPAGCGKKGPPLAPIVRVPAAPQELVVRRQGDDVTVQLRVPAANADGSSPADLDRVEVYAYTGPLPGEQAILEDATLVASIPVRRPPEEQEEGAANAAPPRAPGSMKTGFDQGDTVQVTETIGAEQRQVVVPSGKQKRAEAPDAEAAFGPSLGTWLEIAPPLRPPRPGPGDSRAYVAVAVSRRGRRGAFTQPQRVSLLPAPSTPASVVPTYDEKTIKLSWERPPDFRQATLAPKSNEELLEAKALGLPSTGGGFNIYLAAPTSPDGGIAATSGDPDKRPRQAPLNQSPLAEPPFEEPVPRLGEERCYAVTAVSSFAGGSVESQPSVPACVTLADTFSPPAPKGLAAVGAAGAISLIWERVEAADLAGYLVLRSEMGGKAEPLNDVPIPEATFRDDKVEPGVVYTYSVVAVDRTGNRSAPSNGVEEAAR